MFPTASHRHARIFCALAAAVLLATHARAQAAPASRHQWIELTLHDGGRVRCDLAQAYRVTIAEDRAGVEGPVVVPRDGTLACYLYESDPDPALKAALLAAVRSAPERWLPIGKAVFLNLDDVTAVYFGSDDKGEVARVVIRFDSVLPPQTVNNTTKAARDPHPGIEVRDPASIERLKHLTGSP